MDTPLKYVLLYLFRPFSTTAGITKEKNRFSKTLGLGKVAKLNLGLSYWWFIKINQAPYFQNLGLTRLWKVLWFRLMWQIYLYITLILWCYRNGSGSLDRLDRLTVSKTNPLMTRRIRAKSCNLTVWNISF